MAPLAADASALFQPISIGAMELANRIVMPPMTTMLAEANGEVGERFCAFYAARARGGAALLTSETVEVHPYTHNLSIGDRGFTAIYHDRFTPGLARLTERVHSEGAKISVQLHHAGNAMVQIDPSAPPLAPSPIPYPGGAMPRALSVEEIQELVLAFGAGARRAREAGFDAVDIHGGHGYLIAQFMSAFFNRRSDEYGGDLPGRLRFPLEILREVRRNVGDDFPIIFRFSGDERVADGRSPAESSAIAPHLVAAGASCLSITSGMHFRLDDVVAGLGRPRGGNVESAATIKSAVDVPVMVAGKLGDPLFAASVVARGEVDLVAIGRALVADPEWPNKVRREQAGSIRPCISCNQGCIGALSVGMLFTCMVNPEAGRELELADEAQSRAERPKRVWVAGGGPAGMEAARVAASRGHEVTLFESSQELGGQFRLASFPPRKQELASYLRYLRGQLMQLAVDIRLGDELTSARVRQQRPDVVVVATGGAPIASDLPGTSRENVCLAVEVLEGRSTVGQRVVVVGGGQVGCETAEHLDKLGRDVTLIEMGPGLAPEELPLPRASVLRSLEERRIRTLTETRLLEVGEDCVVVERDGQRERLARVDSVVLALGVRSRDELARELEGEIEELFVIGDARQPGNAVAAIAAAGEIARKL